MTGTTESFRERTAFEDPTDREHHPETPSSVMSPEWRGTRSSDIHAAPWAGNVHQESHTEEVEGRGTVLVLCGEPDFDSAVQLDEVGRRGPGAGGVAGPVVVDLAALTSCGSSALLRLAQPAPVRAQGGSLGPAAVPRTGPSALPALHRLAEAAGVPLHLDRRPPFLVRLLLLTGTYEHLTSRSETAGPDGDIPSGAAEGPRPAGP
ncbi:hypothetical protein ABZY68_36300 [Streptomyces sp. NPDC006482]|uniref:hypothetical protein n=1 Tax=Streptomyces sp. NPDC006482 TaxID=3154306 RepID=UPI0033A30891